MTSEDWSSGFKRCVWELGESNLSLKLPLLCVVETNAVGSNIVEGTRSQEKTILCAMKAENREDA